MIRTTENIMLDIDIWKARKKGASEMLDELYVELTQNTTDIITYQTGTEVTQEHVRTLSNIRDKHISS